MKILRTIWLTLCWGTLLVVTGAAVGMLAVHLRLDDEVQKHALHELEKRYPNLQIKIGTAKIVENKGISVKDIEFSVPHLSGKTRKLLHIGEMFVECPITLRSLYRKDIRISRIVLRNHILRVSRSYSGTFDELQLLFSGDKKSDFKSIDIENGTILYDDARHPAPPLRISGINVAVTPEIQDQTPQILFKGTADGDLFRRVTFEAALLPETKQWKLTANCRQFDWSDDLWQYLPQTAVNPPLFQGRFDFDLSVVSDPAAKWGCRFAVSGALTHGRADFPQLNKTLTELSARFEITNEKITVDKLTGIGDSARFALSYVQEGLSPMQRAELTANLRDLPFDENLIEALAPILNDQTEKLLARFDYKGTTDLHAQIVYQNGQWLPQKVALQVSDVGFAFRDFPYRLDRLSGNLYIDETAALHFHFVTKPEEPIKAVIDGHYHNIFVDAAGAVEITGENVPIDQKLIRTLPPAVQHVAETLHPSGKLNAHLVFELPPGDVPLKKQFDIHLDHVALQYDHFPYPLRDVTGLLKYNGAVWQFEDVLGMNGTAAVKGKGYLKPTDELDDDAQEFVLNVSAEELPIDPQIEQALLNPEQRQLLQSLNVNGKVNLSAQILYRTDSKRLNLCFQAVPRSGLSICPDKFPYKIENVGGEIRYENGHVFAETLTGTHRDTKLRGGLDCRFNAEGQSVLRLAPLAVDQLQSNRELWDALPENLRGFIETLQMTKPYNVSGGIEIRHSPQGEQIATWDLNYVLHQNGAKLGLPVENIFGTVRLQGYSMPNKFQLNGELNLDSLTVYGFQTTSIRGPFFFDGKHIQLGQPANRLTPNVAAQPLTGKFCDGTLFAEGLIFLENGISYSVNTALIGADLAKIAREIEPGATKTSGTLNCINVNLQGSGTKWETVGGSGTIQIRDANIYEAPGMLRLLRELRIKESDPNAGVFRSADINFRLAGLQMFFDPLVFEGNAFSLFGDGMMRLDNREIDLTMKTRLGNKRTQIPILSDIIGGAGDQIVQLKITGPIRDPLVTRVMLPEIQKALQPLEEEAVPEPPVSRNRLAPSRMFQWNPL